ncbi:hypothetical protein B0H13DRAFT_2477569, partial [Mycena leptocephala]
IILGATRIHAEADSGLLSQYYIPGFATTIFAMMEHFVSDFGFAGDEDSLFWEEIFDAVSFLQCSMVAAPGYLLSPQEAPGFNTADSMVYGVGARTKANQVEEMRANGMLVHQFGSGLSRYEPELGSSAHQFPIYTQLSQGWIVGKTFPNYKVLSQCYQLVFIYIILMVLLVTVESKKHQGYKTPRGFAKGMINTGNAVDGGYVVLKGHGPCAMHSLDWGCQLPAFGGFSVGDAVQYCLLSELRFVASREKDVRFQVLAAETVWKSLNCFLAYEEVGVEIGRDFKLPGAYRTATSRRPIPPAWHESKLAVCAGFIAKNIGNGSQIHNVVPLRRCREIGLKIRCTGGSLGCTACIKRLNRCEYASGPRHRGPGKKPKKERKTRNKGTPDKA